MFAAELLARRSPSYCLDPNIILSESGFGTHTQSREISLASKIGGGLWRTVLGSPGGAVWICDGRYTSTWWRHARNACFEKLANASGSGVLWAARTQTILGVKRTLLPRQPIDRKYIQAMVPTLTSLINPTPSQHGACVSRRQRRAALPMTVMPTYFLLSPTPFDRYTNGQPTYAAGYTYFHIPPPQANINQPRQ